MASNTTSFEGSSTQKDDLNELLTCGICLSRMISPCSLSCAHSFCRSCLLDYAEQNNKNAARPTHYILCPYCKSRMNFHSLQQFQSLLIVNPILNQLCQMLENTSQSNPTSSQGACRARCHICTTMDLLKMCKHCSFMLCQMCRKKHLLEVHEQCKLQIETLHSSLRLIDDKRRQMEDVGREYDQLREKIHVYVDGLIDEIEQQRRQALQTIDEQQRANDELFWARNGLETKENFESFISLLETGEKKLSSPTIIDRDLMQLSDDLQALPSIHDEQTMASIDFAKLTLQFEQISPIKQLIHIKKKDSSTTDPETIRDDALPTPI